MPVLINSDKTAPQLRRSVGPTGDPELTKDIWFRNFRVYEDMQLDATIAFARMLAVAPLVTTGWSYEAKSSAPTGAKELIESVCEKFRMQVVKQALEGYIDHGWAGWETIWGVSDSGANVIKKFKHLTARETIILIDEATGAYLGLRQEQGADNQRVELGYDSSMRITIDILGTQWYGRPLLENSRTAYEAGLIVTKASDQYDRKIAGSHWVIHYPIGESPYGPDAKDTDNFIIAKNILASLDYSGQIIVPRRIAQTIDDMNNQVAGEDQWKIELLSDTGTATASFIERNKYLDSLKVRGLGFPERAILEGQFGTKAEAETHANMALVNFEMRHAILCEQFNHQATNLILEYNYGEQAKGSVTVQPIPLANVKQAYWKDIYEKFIADPNVLMAEYQAMDMPTFRKNLDLPENQLETLRQNDPLAAYQADYNLQMQQPDQTGQQIDQQQPQQPQLQIAG